MWTTACLAEFIRSLRPEEVTPAAMEMAKRCLLDLVGAVLAGFDTAAAASLRNAGNRVFGTGMAALWFTGRHFPAPAAALMNSAAASALDVDDGHRAAGGHPGASIIPAALAVAEELKASVEEFLAAVVVGYEVGIRVAAARDFAGLDTLSTGRWCSYGAAAAGGFLRKMPPAELSQAFAIAGVLAPGLSAAGYSAVMGNHVKEGIPWSTLTGLWALDFAEQGLTGPVDLLDHPAYYDRGKILEGLGSSFAIEKVYFKPYSCCRWSHSALDALLAIMAEHRLEPEAIRRVEVHTFGRALRLTNATAPESLEGAQYSIPFSLAVGAVLGREALLPMRAACLVRPEVAAFARKVELYVDPQLDQMFPAKAAARVIVRTACGQYQKVLEDALGDPANPLEPARLAGKFRTLSRNVMTPREQDEMVAAITGLTTGGYRPFLDLLRKPRFPPV